MFAEISFHNRAGRIAGLRPYLKRPLLLFLLVRIRARIIRSFEPRCSPALAAFPRAKTEALADIVLAGQRIIAGGKAIHHKAVRRPRIDSDGERTIGLAMTGARNVAAIPAGNIAAERGGNCASVHHDATRSAIAISSMAKADKNQNAKAFLA
jgi:hypothetical protein